LDFAPLGVVFQALTLDFLGSVRIAQNVSNETNGLFLAGLELGAGELLHRSHFGALVEMLGRVGIGVVLFAGGDFQAVFPWSA
jgi:hypothetical protein